MQYQKARIHDFNKKMETHMKWMQSNHFGYRVFVDNVKFEIAL